MELLHICLMNFVWDSSRISHFWMCSRIRQTLLLLLLLHHASLLRPIFTYAWPIHAQCRFTLLCIIIVLATENRIQGPVLCFFVGFALARELPYFDLSPTPPNLNLMQVFGL